MLMRNKPTGPGSGILIKAAMDYGRLGWSVAPIEPHGKAALIRWEEYQHRHPETTEIGDWFTRWPDANLAIITGVVSDLVVLDLGPQPDGEVGRTQSVQAYGPLPGSVEALSGGGGRHLYFRHPGGILNNRTTLAPGIDVHADGGYVVAPPSVHATGESYRWARSPEVFPLEPLPDWLWHPTVALDSSSQQLAYWRRLAQEGVAAGKRRDAIASLSGLLLDNGVDKKVALELMLCWNALRCRPPLERDAIIHAVGQGECRHREDADDSP